MPMVLYFAGDDLFLGARLDGFVHSADARAARAHILPHRDYPDAVRFLFDARRLKGTDMSATEIHALAMALSRKGRSDRVQRLLAMVADEGSFGFGMARMLHAFAAPLDLLEAEILRDPAAAGDWLGIGDSAVGHMDALERAGLTFG